MSYEKSAKKNLVWAFYAFLSLAIFVPIIIYVIYFTPYNSFIPPENVAGSMGVLLSVAGILLGIFALYVHIDLETRINERKLEEENAALSLEKKKMLNFFYFMAEAHNKLKISKSYLEDLFEQEIDKKNRLFREIGLILSTGGNIANIKATLATKYSGEISDIMLQHLENNSKEYSYKAVDIYDEGEEVFQKFIFVINTLFTNNNLVSAWNDVKNLESEIKDYLERLQQYSNDFLTTYQNYIDETIVKGNNFHDFENFPNRIKSNPQNQLLSFLSIVEQHLNEMQTVLQSIEKENYREGGFYIRHNIIKQLFNLSRKIRIKSLGLMSLCAYRDLIQIELKKHAINLDEKLKQFFSGIVMYHSQDEAEFYLDKDIYKLIDEKFSLKIDLTPFYIDQAIKHYKLYEKNQNRTKKNIELFVHNFNYIETLLDELSSKKIDDFTNNNQEAVEYYLQPDNLINVFKVFNEETQEKFDQNQNVKSLHDALNKFFNEKLNTKRCGIKLDDFERILTGEKPYGPLLKLDNILDRISDENPLELPENLTPKTIFEMYEQLINKKNLDNLRRLARKNNNVLKYHDFKSVILDKMT